MKTLESYFGQLRLIHEQENGKITVPVSAPEQVNADGKTFFLRKDSWNTVSGGIVQDDRPYWGIYDDSGTCIASYFISTTSPTFSVWERFAPKQCDAELLTRIAIAITEQVSYAAFPVQQQGVSLEDMMHSAKQRWVAAGCPSGLSEYYDEEYIQYT